jgi:hypothetical protein
MIIKRIFIILFYFVTINNKQKVETISPEKIIPVCTPYFIDEKSAEKLKSFFIECYLKIKPTLDFIRMVYSMEKIVEHAINK